MTRRPLAVVMGGRRSAIGAYKGGLTPVRPDDLAATVLADLLATLPPDLPLPDELMLGCANQAGEDSRNVARQVGLLAGLSPRVPAVTVNRLCGSSSTALIQAAQAIGCGQARLVLAGGLEHMSRAVMTQLPPWIEPDAPPESSVFGWRFTNPRFLADPALQSHHLTMVQAALHNATTLGIARSAQEAVVLQSHHRAQAAWLAGQFGPSLTAIPSPHPQWANRDEVIRPALTSALLERLPTLQPGGSITAASAAAFADGAAWLSVADPSLRPYWPADTVALAIVDTQTVAGEVQAMGLAPVTAMTTLLDRHGLTLADMDLIEWHEAFAATQLACCQALSLDWQDPRLNGWGGSLALGAPMGMVGARLMITLYDRFVATPTAKWGLIALPIGMGQAQAVLCRRL
jgi:acetyl-CoA acetyltransferase family protein